MSGLRVLIVEDDIIYAETVKILLERERHTVVGIAAHTSPRRARLHGRSTLTWPWWTYT